MVAGVRGKGAGLRWVSPWKDYLSLDERFSSFLEIAGNFFWSWHPEARKLWEKIDPDLWEEVSHLPVEFLKRVEVSKFERFLPEARRIADGFPQLYSEHEIKVVYFCAEYGIHSSLPIYSGGLGVLAGDHLKTASDMNYPLAGVGLLYRSGYFRQRIFFGQREEFPEYEFEKFPLDILYMGDSPYVLRVKVPENFSGRPVEVGFRIWRAKVGRVPLYLLDTDFEGNPEWARRITRKLYTPEQGERIAQYILLGVGGVRTVELFHSRIKKFHLNEGHAAFAGFTVLAEALARGLNFQEALELSRKKLIFTTHTPVPAGNDSFSRDVIFPFLQAVSEDLSLDTERLFFLGSEGQPPQIKGTFGMTVLAMALSGKVNAVSRLHERVSKRLWRWVYPQLPVEKLPIFHITNGVHTPTWIDENFDNLFQRYVSGKWRERITDFSIWEKVEKIPAERLWEAKLSAKKKAVEYMRRRVPEGMNSSIDSDKLIIGFARRFATYKRALLVFRDPERLKRILDMGVQIVFAGKAHPADEGGKALINQILTYASQEFEGQVFFLENYDLDLAKVLVSGVDVWLNNPRRPLEASGTSGQKAVVNGTLHFSVLDGWWDEAYVPGAGWAIGDGSDWEDTSRQDEEDALSLYWHLENEIVPAFYQRNEKGIPEKWIEYTKKSMKLYIPEFSSFRMLEDYVREAYED